MRRRVFTLAALTLALGWSVGLAAAEKAYGPGVTDAEIKLGANAPYSGAASIYASFPKTMIAYFTMLNEKGGINGRKIDFVTRDDAYSPPKTVEVTRALVENDNVLAIMAPSVHLPTPPSRNISIQTACRSCWCRAAARDGTIPNNFPGPHPTRQPT